MTEVGFESETSLVDAEAAAVAQPVDRPTSAGSEIKTIGRHTLVYALGVGISKLAGFIMLPVYTRFLTPADYGVLELLSMTIDLVGMIVGIGIAASVFKFHAEAETRREQNQIISTASFSVLALASTAAIVGLLASPLLARMLITSDEGTIYFRLFFGIYFLQTAESIPLLLLRVNKRSFLFVAVNVIKLFSMLTLNIVFVVTLRMGVLGVLLSTLIVSVFSAVILTTYMFRNVGFGFSRTVFVKTARFGYPLVLWFVANFVVIFSNRYFLNHYVGPSAVGLYSLGAKMVFVMSAFAITPFQMIWDPQRFTIAKRPDAREIYARVFSYMNLALGCFALLIGLFVFDTIRFIAAPDYRGAAAVVPTLLAAQVLFHWTAFNNLGLFLNNKTHTLAMLAVFGVVAVLGLNFVLIPSWGIQGAAVAALIAYAIRFAAVHFFSQREYRIEYPWAPIVRMYAIVGAVIGFRQLFTHLRLVPSVALSVALTALSLGAIYAVVLTDGERTFLKRFFAQPRLILSFGSTRA